MNKYFLLASRVADNVRKASAFLSVIRSDTFKLLESSLAINSVEERTFDQPVEKLTQHFSPHDIKFFACLSSG